MNFVVKERYREEKEIFDLDLVYFFQQQQATTSLFSHHDFCDTQNRHHNDMEKIVFCFVFVSVLLALTLKLL